MATSAEKEYAASTRSLMAQQIEANRSRLSSTLRVPFGPRKLRAAGDLSGYGIGSYADDPVPPYTTPPTPPTPPGGTPPPVTPPTVPPTPPGKKKKPPIVKPTPKPKKKPIVKKPAPIGQGGQFGGNKPLPRDF